MKTCYAGEGIASANSFMVAIQKYKKKSVKLRHPSPSTVSCMCPINIVSHFWQARSSLLLDHSCTLPAEMFGGVIFGWKPG